MKSILGLLAFLPTIAFASADCEVHPKDEWASKSTLRQALIEEGYDIKVLHVSGNCYEMYGLNKKGKRAEIYFDTKTLAIVKAEIEK